MLQWRSRFGRLHGVSKETSGSTPPIPVREQTVLCMLQEDEQPTFCKDVQRAKEMLTLQRISPIWTTQLRQEGEVQQTPK